VGKVKVERVPLKLKCGRRVLVKLVINYDTGTVVAQSKVPYMPVVLFNNVRQNQILRISSLFADKEFRSRYKKYVTAVARCDSRDTFTEDTGKSIALDKLKTKLDTKVSSFSKFLCSELDKEIESIKSSFDKFI
jgi:hypothetical protein